jgi:cathepsin X
MSDRISIMRNGAWPEIKIAPQVLLNCGSAGSCSGGWPTAAWEYINSQGLPDMTCALYEAIDKDCTAENICKTCSHGGGCSAVTNYTTYYVDEYGSVSGEVRSHVRPLVHDDAGFAAAPYMYSRYDSTTCCRYRRR